MPNVHLTKEQVRDLTTFLMGSEETSLPASLPVQAGRCRHDIQEGWWIVKKYNCMGCHQFIPGQKTILMGLPQYQDIQEQLPPKLLTEGARVDPEWLRKFLSNPALNTSDTNRNGVRPYLKVRMPTFSFRIMNCASWCASSGAVAAAVAVYSRGSAGAHDQGNGYGEDFVLKRAAPCLKCHATGDPQHDKIATRAELSSGERTFEARLGGAMDYRPTSGESGNIACRRDYSSSRIISGCLRGRRRRRSGI